MGKVWMPKLCSKQDSFSNQKVPCSFCTYDHELYAVLSLSTSVLSLLKVLPMSSESSFKAKTALVSRIISIVYGTYKIYVVPLQIFFILCFKSKFKYVNRSFSNHIISK